MFISRFMKISHWFEGEWRQTHKPRHNDYLTILLIAFFLLGDSPASEFYVPMFRNTLFHLHRRYRLTLPMKMGQSVPKHWHIKFRCQRITQKKEYNIQNTAKVWNQESCLSLKGRLSYEWSNFTSRSIKYFLKEQLFNLNTCSKIT